MWLCAGATFFHRSFEFLFGGFEVPTVRLGLDRWSEVFHRSFELSIGFLGVSCCRAVYNRLVGAFPVRLRLWLVNQELVGEAVVLW